MRNKQFHNLQSRADAIEQEALALEIKNRPEEETEFFIVHGYWPEAAQVDQRTETSFTTYGMKTTIILERTESTES
jgi:ribonuclease I